METTASTPMDRLLTVISDYCKTAGNLHTDYLKMVCRDIERFEEITNNLSSQMVWQSRTIVGLSLLGASLAVAGTLLPKGSDDYASLPFAEKLQNNEFLRSTCKTAAETFFPKFTDAAKIGYDSSI